MTTDTAVARKVAYLSKEMPFGATEAFILPEVADHMAAGWDVWLVPLSKAEMVHGRHLLERSLVAPVLSAGILLGAAKAFVRRPAAALGMLATVMRAPSLSLTVRNLAVFPKGLWLSTELRRRGFDHVHIHWIAAPATMGVVAARMAEIPYSITAHRYDIAQANLLAWKAGGARFVRVIDQPGAAELSGHLPPSVSRPIVLHMGVNAPAKAVERRAGSLDTLRVAVAARLVGKKGHRYLIEAIKLAGEQGVDVRLDVFGDGPLKSELTANANELGVGKNITWRGVTRHDSLLEALASGDFDVAALTSVTASDGDKEGIPVFLIESMATGLPVVTTANGGIEELAGDGHGIIVPERDSAAIAEALVRLARDGALRDELATRGRHRVLAEFEIGACMHRFRELVDDKANAVEPDPLIRTGSVDHKQVTTDPSQDKLA